MPFHPHAARRLLAIAVFSAIASTLSAMTVVAPTFKELVTEADFVVRGVVTDIHCITVDSPQGTAIETLVTLHVERVLKGAPGAEVTLNLLGGKVGRRRLTVVGMPEFKVGDREIVFVANNGHVICPLIAAGHGRYHVKHDALANRDYVLRDNHAPLNSTDEISTALEDRAASARAAAPTAPLTVDDFESQIAATVHQGTPSQP